MEQNEFSKQVNWPLSAVILALATIIAMGLTLISCSEPAHPVKQKRTMAAHVALSQKMVQLVAINRY